MTDEEKKDFVATNFSDYSKSTRDEENLRKNAKLLYVFLTVPDEAEKYVHSDSTNNCIHCYNVEILNIFEPELHLINTKAMIIKRIIK